MVSIVSGKTKRHLRLHAPLLLLIVIYSFLSGSGWVYPEEAGSYIIIPHRSNFIVYGKGSEYFILRQEKFLNAKIKSNIKKLSSGLRIVTAEDDPAGFAVAEKMKAIIREIEQLSLNEEDLKNYYAFVESAIAQDADILKRMRVLVLHASGGILSRDDREIIQHEIETLKRAIDMNAAFSQFNTKLVIPMLTTQDLKLHSVDVISNLSGSLDTIDRALARLTKMRSRAGIRSSLMELRIRGRSVYYIALQSAESRIRDLDIAAEVSRLLKNATMLKVPYGLILQRR
jgi:flagellin